jgi:hypothetical protein
MSEKPSTKKLFPFSSPLLNSMQLLPLPALRFPSVSELAGSVAPDAPASRPSGLFENFVGDPAVLLQDLLHRPTVYQEGVLELLLALIAGRKSLPELTAEELALLDEATLKFMEPLPKPTPEVRTRPAEEEMPELLEEGAKEAAAQSEEGAPEIDPNAPPEAPERMKLFWWEQKPTAEGSPTD